MGSLQGHGQELQPHVHHHVGVVPIVGVGERDEEAEEFPETGQAVRDQGCSCGAIKGRLNTPFINVQRGTHVTCSNVTFIYLILQHIPCFSRFSFSNFTVDFINWTPLFVVQIPTVAKPSCFLLQNAYPSTP